MRCPNCNEYISLYSKAINARQKVKTCPNCQEELVMKADFKKIFIIFPISFIAYLFILVPLMKYFGYENKWVGLIVGAFVFYASLTLKTKKIKD